MFVVVVGLAVALADGDVAVGVGDATNHHISFVHTRPLTST